ncbi:MAG: hypothetical protein ACQRW7_11455 [Caulobacterales bacterium]|uniref:hypothetical protein n=1 Tax=Glycocaulis sp. TaxID=1969725 RepID=UPI003FA024AD
MSIEATIAGLVAKAKNVPTKVLAQRSGLPPTTIRMMLQDGWSSRSVENLIAVEKALTEIEAEVRP